MVVTVQAAALCDVSPCSLAVTGILGVHPVFNYEDGGSTFHLNVGFHQQDYKVSQIGRPQSEISKLASASKFVL